MPVNPNEAPEGFEAAFTPFVASCGGCVFESKCMPWERKDGMNVIFVPRTTKPATANWPHDDMGTPV